MPRGNQLERQWRLLQSLCLSPGLAIDDAAGQLGCAGRTVRRDLEVLDRAGFPIYEDRDGRRVLWKVEEGFRNRLPVPLSLAELVALLVSRDLLDHRGAGPFGPALASVFGKIRALLGPRALELVDRMRATVGARTVGTKLQLGAAEHMTTIQEALAERRTLEIRYYSLSRHAETDRRVDPYHLTFFNGGLYLVGHCHLRREPRIFAVDRIRSAAALRTTFAMPADFDPEAYLRGAWGIMRGTLVAVRAVFSAVAAPHVRGRLWHPSQELHELAGGRLRLHLTVADTLEVRRWFLGFGADVEVLEPLSLREDIRREAERLAQALAPATRPLAPAAAGRSPAERRPATAMPPRRSRAG